VDEHPCALARLFWLFLRRFRWWRRCKLPHTTVIARDGIERSQAADLPTLLSSEAGFQFTQNGGRGTSSNLFLRGSATLGVLVLIDGVPMTKQDSTGSVSLEHIMLDQVERVEIVRGNVSAIYGSGAIGGVIQVFMRQGHGQTAGFAQLEVGSFGTTKAVAGISGQVGNSRFSAGLGMHRTDGFSSMNTSQYPNENSDADGYRNTNYNLALSHELAKGQILGASAQGSDGEFDFDGGGFGSATDLFKGRNAVDTWSVFSHNQFTSSWRSELTLSHGRERSIYDARLTTFPYDSEAVTRSRTVNWANSVGMGNWLVTLGAENQQQSIDTNDSTASQLNRDRSVKALYAGLSGMVAAHSVQANIRRDDANGLDVQTTGYLGYGFNLTPAWKVIASTSTAFNLPPLGYLYDPFSGNLQLRPETARSNEFGLQWAESGQVVRATVFSTRVSDLMLYDFATYSFNNVSDASNKGLEVSYSGKLVGADLRASLTQQNPVNESTGQQLIRRAKTMASFGASLPWGAWVLGGDVRYTGERPDVPALPMLDAYTVANLTARYTLTPELALTVRIDNLFDSQYQTAYGYNQSGRAAYVGIVWKQK
jgi:vitamin B12 transporter